MPKPRAYTLAELAALRITWHDTSKGGIDPYEVDKFLEWMATAEAGGSVPSKVQYVRPEDLHSHTTLCGFDQCVAVIPVRP